MRVSALCFVMLAASSWGCERRSSLEPAESARSPGERLASHEASAPERAASHTSSPGNAGTEGESRVPVVVELFSSEGCSSCPPADDNLRWLSETQPVDGAWVIPLELHVDYWNDLGWSDPFSRAEFSARQRTYSEARGARGVFTPEAVIDGSVSVVGTERQTLSTQIRAAAGREHRRVHVDVAGNQVRVAIEGPPLRDVDAWLAITESGLSTEVRAGENQGRTLRHAPVVRAMRRAFSASSSSAVVELPVLPSPRERLRAVVFLQSDAVGSIVGASSAPLGGATATDAVR